MRHLACGFLLLSLLAACGGSASPGTGGAGGGGTTSTTSSSSSTSTSSSSGGGTSSTSSSSSSTGTGSSSSSTSSSTSSTSSSSSSGGSAHGDCYVDTDCPDGKCVELTPGGFHVCQTPPMKAASCESSFDQCCPDKACPNNEPCYGGPLVPICAGIIMEPHNQCAVDQCTQDADCAQGQVCAPAGTLGRKIRACLSAGCKVDADCTAAAGGVCAPVQEPCCGVAAGLFCVYPTGGCRSSADCPAGQYCEIDGKQAVCHDGAPVCPA